MKELPVITPDYFQILAVRELRKVGFDVGAVRIHRRSELGEAERGFVLELLVSLGNTRSTVQALVVCRQQAAAVGREVIDSVKARVPEVRADVGVVFATADFAPDALVAAHDAGVALLRVVDGRGVFRASGWGEGTGGAPDHYPAWLPAHMAQLVDRDAGGRPRFRVLEAGRPEMMLDCLRLQSSAR
jgi:hypothetical protein